MSATVETRRHTSQKKEVKSLYLSPRCDGGQISSSPNYYKRTTRSHLYFMNGFMHQVSISFKKFKNKRAQVFAKLGFHVGNRFITGDSKSMNRIITLHFSQQSLPLYPLLSFWTSSEKKLCSWGEKPHTQNQDCFSFKDKSHFIFKKSFLKP